ncbi:hypothetical protein A4S05_37535 [Nostoc sp. KVJ20]|nr:hypothetical protein A4S05_37535 [Nostoc sp. KVJ20]
MYTLKGHSDAVRGVAFSPDGKTIASVSSDKTVKLWNAATGKEISTLKGHSDAVWGVAFSPDGKTIASASLDKSVKLWNAGTGNLKNLIAYSCTRLRPYLQSNPNVSDRTLCDGIGTKSD